MKNKQIQQVNFSQYLHKAITLIVFTIISYNSFSQQIFYQDILNGGVTGNGGTTSGGSGTFYFSVNIPVGSTIKKAYLLAARDSLGDDITVILNGIPST